MEKKLRKQRRRLVVRISAILLAVWLILSGAYAVVAFLDEKERAYNDSRIAFSDLTEAVSLPDNSFFAIDEARKSAVAENRIDLSGGQNGDEHNVDVTIIASRIKDKVDFGDILNICFTSETEDPEYRESHFGYLSFKSFRGSMTDEQYEKILSYLDHQPADDSYYELLCTEFYRTADNQLLPKTVQIVLTKDAYKWYVQDTVTETFELEPAGTEGLSLHHISYLDRNEIPEEFIRNAFGGSLIKTAQRLSQENDSGHSGEEELLRESLTTYLYYDHEAVTAWLTDVSYEEYEKILEKYGYFSFTPEEKRYDVYYARRLDILDGCEYNILNTAVILLIFFLTIGVILTVMMWKSMKTQMIEEQKRRDMTNALAHDIKTPLFILSGYADNLKENVQTEKRAHYADVIVEQSREVNRRVNRMLELSKLDSPDFVPKKQEFDLAELVSEILRYYEALSDGKRIECRAGNCTVNADRDLIKRAVENLIDNAVKYSDPDSVITISVTNNTLEVSNVCSSVMGSDLKTMARPFARGDKARTSEKAVQGSGLGLSIVKAVCDLHRMKLTDTVHDKTVTFTISGFSK
ncbi:MAG: HAMP domain-containing histidine kinase [Ruminococcus sp.]|nr:HAMP domain-containing histidine kinase [Ruminococcus sp.]